MLKPRATVPYTNWGYTSRYNYPVPLHLNYTAMTRGRQIVGEVHGMTNMPGIWSLPTISYHHCPTPGLAGL